MTKDEALKLALEQLEECADLLKMFEAPIDSCVGATMLQAEAAITTIKQAVAAPVQEPLTDSFVQLVPDKCDRIVWRGKYHHLPPAAPVQEPPDDGFTQALIERDEYHAIADELAEMIARITGEDIGEHTSANFPWRNALDAAENWLCHPPAPTVQEPVAWTIWLHGPVDLFLHKQFAELEFERRNKQYPDKDRKLRPLVFGDTTPPAAQPATEKSSVVQTAPVQEPVGKVIASVPHLRSISVELLAEAPIPSEDSLIYTTPPAAQRQWVGLTDEEIKAVIAKIDPNEHYLPNALRQLSLALEAKLKAKNSP